MTDMTNDVFASSSFGQVALRKLAPVSDNFRLFFAGWLEEKPDDWQTMKVTGALFRQAKSGRNKGKLSILVKGSQRSVYVTKQEIASQGSADMNQGLMSGGMEKRN